MCAYFCIIYLFILLKMHMLSEIHNHNTCPKMLDNDCLGTNYINVYQYLTVINLRNFLGQLIVLDTLRSSVDKVN